MNFGEMWSVQNNSDLLYVSSNYVSGMSLIAPNSFWEIAIPIMVVIIPAFILPDIQRMFHYVQKQLASKKAVKARPRNYHPNLIVIGVLTILHYRHTNEREHAALSSTTNSYHMHTLDAFSIQSSLLHFNLF